MLEKVHAQSAQLPWRITFAFSDKDAVDVDYEDYH